MRILQISSAKSYGGGEKHLVELSRGLTEKGHKVFVAIRSESIYMDRLHFLPSENLVPISPKNALDIFSAKKIANLLGKQDIDIVHAHLARDYPPASMAVRLYPKSKLILTRHVLFPMKSLHLNLIQNTSKIIAVSTAVEANLDRNFPREKIAFIPNGIDTPHWADANHEALDQEFRSDMGIPPGAPLIGTVGELKKLKGQEDFILAAGEIVKSHPDAHFVIVGKDNSLDQGFRRKLKRLVKVTGLEKQFKFLNWIEDTAPLMSALDVFVSASHSESFGLAILEAMASGTAVVATKTEGAKELLWEGESGLLTEIGNPVKLAKKVCEMLENEDNRKSMSKVAQDVANSNFSLKKMIDLTESVYRRAVEGAVH